MAKREGYILGALVNRSTRDENTEALAREYGAGFAARAREAIETDEMLRENARQIKRARIGR
jgi:hypothetical protein